MASQDGKGELLKPDKNIDSVVDSSLPHAKSIQQAGLKRRIEDQVIGAVTDVMSLSCWSAYYAILQPMEWAQKTLFPIHGVPRDGNEVTKVAIIGGGAAGVSAAYTLNLTEGFEFDLYEKSSQIGGHSFTFDMKQKDGRTIPVDMGFIFGHHFSYGNLLEMMKHKGVKSHRADLSMSVEVDGTPWKTDGVDQSGKPVSGVMHPDGRAECDRFMRLAERNFNNPIFNVVPIEWVLSLHGFDERFKTTYLSPVLITLFVTESGLYNYSARFFFNMFAGPHKFVDLRTLTQCFTVTGGTHKWFEAIAEDFKDSVKVNCPVRGVRRITENGKNKVLVESKDGIKVYDHVIFSCGALIAAMLLKNKSWLESFIFKQIRYETAVTTLHTDTSYLPEDSKDLNFHHRRYGDHIELTGNMGVIQNNKLKEMDPIPVLTLDPYKKIPEDKILHQWSGAVHVQDVKHLLVTRLLLPSIQGSGNVWYGNSFALWMGHAAAIDAGALAATRIGGNFPFKEENSKYFAKLNAFDMFGDRFDFLKQNRPIKSKL